MNAITTLTVTSTTLSLTVFTKRNFVADFLQAKCDFRRKIAFFAFLSPLGRGGGLGATYDDHLKLIGKRVADFLLMLLHLIAIGVIRLRRYESLWVQIGDFAPTRAG